MGHKCLFKVDPWEFATIQSLKEFISLELTHCQSSDIRIYGRTGQEIFDIEDMLESNILFFTTEGNPY